MTEVWKSIKGYEGIYEVSNLGGVRNCNGVERKLNTCGRYPIILLCKNGKKRQFKVHRLVAMAFIPNTFLKPYVNHINGVKTDNRVENLEWVTHSENMLHSFSIGLHKPNTIQIRKIKQQAA